MTKTVEWGEQERTKPRKAFIQNMTRLMLNNRDIKRGLLELGAVNALSGPVFSDHE